jgi:glycosyltransferase involved in cell wall biosynthesis
MKRPRVLLVITLAEAGGAQTYVASLLPALVDRFDVTVAAHGPGPLREEVEANRARFVALRHVRRPIKPWRDVLGLVELLILMRRERPHILHANSSKAGFLGRIAAWLTGVPIRIFTAHGWAFLQDEGSRSAAYRWGGRLVRRLTTTTVCVCERDRLAGIAAGTCSEATTLVIHSGVEVGAVPPRDRRNPRPARIISVGRLKAPKDTLTLIRALGRLPAGTF